MAGQKGFIANYPYTASFKKDLDFLKNFDAALIINPDGKMVKSFVESEKYINIMLSYELFYKANYSS